MQLVRVTGAPAYIAMASGRRLKIEPKSKPLSDNDRLLLLYGGVTGGRES